MSEWGRVDDDGTVYVRAADGTERAVGSWQAGNAVEGLAHYRRRYESLATEVTLLEQRLRSGAGDPGQVATSARRLAQSLPTASAVGDLAALERRVQALLQATEEAQARAREARQEARAAAAVRKTELAEEAERLADSSDWKASGDRLRAMGEDWKALPRLERKADDELWQRVAAARQRFAERRSAHFAALGEQREVARARKQKLVAEAESLSSSTDWKGTAERFRSLMADWKAAGRAPREVEEGLWTAFKSAQDAFFAARSAAFAVQDEQFRGNQRVKEAIVSEAEALDVAGAPDRAAARLRELQERWEEAGKVPRDAMRSLEDRMAAVERRVRAALEQRWRAAAASPFEVRLREKVAELEDKLARARSAGRETDELEQQLATQREWLTQAGAQLPTAAAPQEPSEPPRKKPTTAWVRAQA